MKAREPTASHEVRFIQAAVDPITTAAEIYIEFSLPVPQNIVLKHLLEQGGAGIMQPTTFKNTTEENCHAADAVLRIATLGGKTGQAFVSGTLPKTIAPYIKRMSPNHQGTDAAYDVVKKRQRIEKASDVALQFNEDVLMDFINFSDHVSDALREIQSASLKLQAEELQWLSSNPDCTRQGNVYAAWNPCFPELIKIGATKMDNPFIRIKALSGANVPRPFQLISSFQSASPFRLEKLVHSHFESARLRDNGAGTEFFQLSCEEVSLFFSSGIENLGA